MSCQCGTKSSGTPVCPSDDLKLSVEHFITEKFGTILSLAISQLETSIERKLGQLAEYLVNAEECEGTADVDSEKDDA